MHLSNPIPPDIQFFPKLSLITNIIASITVSQQNILPTAKSITQVRSHFGSFTSKQKSRELITLDFSIVYWIPNCSFKAFCRT